MFESCLRDVPDYRKSQIVGVSLAIGLGFRKCNVNAVDCSSVLRVTCPCCFVCVCVFCDSFLCSISLLLLSDSLSCVLNSVL